jgi:type III pantothenate kinase
MTPDVVVDIGNTRVKWGWGEPMRTASLPPDEPAAWDAQLAHLPAADRRTWVVASVHPPRLARFTEWATGRGDTVRALTHADIPLPSSVEDRTKVGIDRLLAAVAARALAQPRPAIVIGIGTAVTGDLVDESGTFLGGVIFPGPRLMAESLHAWTAQLPCVEAGVVPETDAPGRNTVDAIRAGIRAAIVGAVYYLVDRYHVGRCSPWVIVTGGAAGSVGAIDFGDPYMGTRAVPSLVLDGIRHVAEALS